MNYFKIYVDSTKILNEKQISFLNARKKIVAKDDIDLTIQLPK